MILSCYCSAGDYIPDPDEVVRVIAELLPASIRGCDAECGENLVLFYNWLKFIRFSVLAVES